MTTVHGEYSLPNLVKPEKINDLFGFGPSEHLEVKEKVQTPNGYLVKMTHRFKGYEVYQSTAVVSEDNAGFLSDAGSCGLAKGLTTLAEKLDFDNPPHPSDSITACQAYIVETNLMPIITNAIVRNRYVYVYHRDTPTPGPAVFVDEVQIDGDQDTGEPFSRILLYDTLGRRVINSWSALEPPAPGSDRLQHRASLY